MHADARQALHSPFRMNLSALASFCVPWHNVGSLPGFGDMAQRLRDADVVAAARRKEKRRLVDEDYIGASPKIRRRE